MSYPPPGGYGGAGGAAPNNNMTISIVSAIAGFLFCCVGIIPGVVAIVNANKVQGLWTAGDHAGANKAAADAKKWATVALVMAGIGLVINVIYFVALAGSGST